MYQLWESETCIEIKGCQWKKETENLLSQTQFFNRCKIYNKFWVVLSISWTFGLFAENKETCNCHKQRFT